MLSFAVVTCPNKIKMTSLNTLLVGGNLQSNKGLSKCYFESSESDKLQLKPVPNTFFEVIIFLIFLLMLFIIVLNTSDP